MIYYYDFRIIKALLRDCALAVSEDFVKLIVLCSFDRTFDVSE